ncbi:cupin domain-containing protein [uncultured Nitratireductor sp.]|uniref:cupin domain-containing protein n=1 Tax=uncultured Nitratireductor sp. TaxID=520953 RepID=UPI0025F6C19F|nr:cupin domain-containing protein [uncultured Nitratireductor sp.]
MYQLIRRSEQTPSPKGTVTFEGEPYGGEVSMFIMDSPPGHATGLHKHPYSETWVLRSGEAEFTVNGETTRAHAGDIIVVPAQTPHRFANVGAERLDMVCIHASGRIMQDDL